jgi:hypothetical protein
MLKSITSLVVLFSFTACATAQPLTITLIPRSDWVEVAKLPPTPMEDVLVSPSSTAVGLSAGEKAPFGGVLLPEDKLSRSLAYKARYDELRVNYTEDRKIWTSHRELYEDQLKACEKKFKELQPGWFDQHKLELGILGGIVLGIAATAAAAKVTK